MRLALISDLHSNLEALSAVLEHAYGQGVQAIGCLGDVVGYGPDPEACIDLVRAKTIFCLQGNHDAGVFDGAADFNPLAREALVWTRQRLRPRWYHRAARRSRWEWLKDLQPSHCQDGLCFYHGSPKDPLREYVLSTDRLLNLPKLEAIFGRIAGPVFVGHTHHPGLFDDHLLWHGLDGSERNTLALDRSRKAVVNVGSVGQPRDGDPRACYAILDGDSLTFWRVPYDSALTGRKISATGRLPMALAERLRRGR